jgi:hypothetical protein
MVMKITILKECCGIFLIFMKDLVIILNKEEPLLNAIFCGSDNTLAVSEIFILYLDMWA